jgi:hypothetical protein
MKSKLTTQHKLAIIKQLACLQSPSEVVEALKSEFGVKLSKQQVSHYDPTVKQSRGKLKPEWIELFEQTRADFINEISRVPISHRTYRLMQLDRLYHSAFRAKNYVLAMKVLEQAAKECGGFYDSAKPVGTSSGADSGVVNLEEWKRLRGILTKSG